MNLDDLLKDSSIEAKAETGKQWSEYQKAVFTHIRESRKSRIVEAVAGSGKTTTIVEGMKYLPQGSSALFLAFNRAIADELGQRVPAGVQASTFHALGVYILRQFGSHVGIPRNFSILDRGDSLGLIKKAIKSLGLDVKQFEPARILRSVWIGSLIEFLFVRHRLP